jgi:hypothetical protein
MALNIAAMLISFLALIALANGILGGIHNHHIAWFPVQPAADLRRLVCADRVGHWSSLARLPCDRQSSGHAWC